MAKRKRKKNKDKPQFRARLCDAGTDFQYFSMRTAKKDNAVDLGVLTMAELAECLTGAIGCPGLVPVYLGDLAMAILEDLNFEGKEKLGPLLKEARKRRDKWTLRRRVT